MSCRPRPKTGSPPSPDILEDDDWASVENLQEFQRALQQIKTQGSRCKQITHKLLSFARKTDERTQEVDPRALARDAHATAVEDLHREVKAAALVTEQVRRRHATVREVDLGGARRLDAHLGLGFSDRDARGGRLDDETADSLRLLVFLRRAREDDE